MGKIIESSEGSLVNIAQKGPNHPGRNGNVPSCAYHVDDETGNGAG